jgi:hypothetical protein
LKKDSDEMDKRDDGIPPKMNSLCALGKIANKEGKKMAARKIFQIHLLLAF